MMKDNKRWRHYAITAVEKDGYRPRWLITHTGQPRGAVLPIAIALLPQPPRIGDRVSIYGVFADSGPREGDLVLQLAIGEQLIWDYPSEYPSDPIRP